MISNTINLLSAGTYSLYAVHQIGLEILRDNLQNAFLFYTSSPIPIEETRNITESVLFIQGSGLDATIETFGINLNAETLRETFLEWATYYKRKSR